MKTEKEIGVLIEKSAPKSVNLTTDQIKRYEHLSGQSEFSTTAETADGYWQESSVDFAGGFLGSKFVNRERVVVSEDEEHETVESGLYLKNKKGEYFPVAEGSEPDIGENIRRARESLSLTQTRFAELVGTTQNMISRYESGDRTPDGYQLIKYAQVLGIDPGELLK